MMAWCWVVGGGPTSAIHWLNIACFLGCHLRTFTSTKRRLVSTTVISVEYTFLESSLLTLVTPRPLCPVRTPCKKKDQAHWLWFNVAIMSCAQWMWSRIGQYDRGISFYLRPTKHNQVVLSLYHDFLFNFVALLSCSEFNRVHFYISQV